MARPTDYTPKLVQKARLYVERMWKAHLDGKVAYPSIAELALELGVHRDTVYEWSKAHEEFSDIIKRLLTLQELSLSDNGLFGNFNPTITKLMLSKHGYRESQDITSGDKPIAPLLVRFLDGKQDDKSAE